MEVDNFLNLPFLLEKDEDGIWIAESPIFNGFFTQGSNLKELQENLEDISAMYFDMIKEGEKIFKSSKLINITYNKNGEITNNISKELNKNIEEEIIQKILKLS